MAGYVQQSFLLTFYIFSAGIVVALLVCLPDYPFYNTHPLPWQQPVKPAVADGEVTSEVTAEEVAGVHEAEGEAQQEEEEEAVVVVKKKKKGSKKPTAAASGARQ